MMELIRFNIGDREIQGDDYFAVIEPVFLLVSIYDGPQRYEEDLANFSTEQRLNGGHDQFYYNGTGIVWPDAVEAFRELGHLEVVAIINASVKRLGGNPSLDREERQQQMEQMKPNFEDLDQELFRLEERADFDDKVLEFIRTHRESFLFSGAS